MFGISTFRDWLLNSLLYIYILCLCIYQISCLFRLRYVISVYVRLLIIYLFMTLLIHWLFMRLFLHLCTYINAIIYSFIYATVYSCIYLFHYSLAYLYIKCVSLQTPTSHIISTFEPFYVISIKYGLSLPDDGSCVIRNMLE
jgi:hypothetical protein